MKTGRLQAFSFCPTCRNIRAVQGATIAYYPDKTEIRGTCASCGSPVNVTGRRRRGPKIGADKRSLN